MYVLELDEEFSLSLSCKENRGEHLILSSGWSNHQTRPISCMHKVLLLDLWVMKACATLNMASMWVLFFTVAINVEGFAPTLSFHLVRSVTQAILSCMVVMQQTSTSHKHKIVIFLVYICIFTPCLCGVTCLQSQRDATPKSSRSSKVKVLMFFLGLLRMFDKALHSATGLKQGSRFNLI